MSLRIQFGLALFLFLTSFLNPAFVSAVPFELRYDDGSFDYTWSDFHPVAAAVRFSPPSQIWAVSEVSFYGVCSLTKQPLGDFCIQIYDERLNLMYQRSCSFSSFFEDRNATFGWYAVEVPNVVVRGDFYVVISPRLTLDGPKLWIGVDDDEPIGGRSFTIDANSHGVIRCWDAASEFPRNFMIRAKGAPTEAPPELKLVSVEVVENETLLRFSVLRANLKGVEAKLFTEIGDVKDCKVVVLDNSSFLVGVKFQGSLSISVEIEGGYVTMGLDVGGNLRDLYLDLLARCWTLGNESARLSNYLNRLAERNELLSQALNESDAMIWVLNRRVERLTQNVTLLEEENGQLKEDNLRLSNERTWLCVWLIALAAVAASLSAIEVRRWWRR